MAWGYRLDVLSTAEASRLRSAGRVCAVRGCEHQPRYRSCFRYSRSSGGPVTTSRPLCPRHARVFSMKYVLAWPHLARRVRRAGGAAVLAAA